MKVKEGKNPEGGNVQILPALNTVCVLIRLIMTLNLNATVQFDSPEHFFSFSFFIFLAERDIMEA